MSLALIERADDASSGKLRLTAAAVSDRHVAVVTVFPARGALHLDLDGCALFELKEDSSSAFRELTASLKAFLEAKGISALFLRKGAGHGPRAAPPLHIKLEFRVHRTPDDPVKFVPGHVIGRWIKDQPLVLPAACSWLGAGQRMAQRAAIETAAYELVKRQSAA